MIYIPTIYVQMTSTQFDSEGFDLGAAEIAEDNNESVVYEISGGVTTQQKESPTKKQCSQQQQIRETSPMDKAEELKEQGNAQFKAQNYLDAYDYYTDAILATPYGESIGLSGDELLQLREEFDESNRERLLEKQRKEMEKRRSSSSSSDSNGEDKKEDEEEEEDNDDQPIETFNPPRHIYGHKLAVYYANRAATLLHLERNGEVITDCDISLLYNPTYIKAYLRRSTANERIENTEEALKDAKMAYELDPTNKVAQKNVSRLTKIENERLEKLKEETMDKLKGLGNSLLSNFGLSLDNFNAVQDPKTGGYSISFDQGKK